MQSGLFFFVRVGQDSCSQAAVGISVSLTLDAITLPIDMTASQEIGKLLILDRYCEAILKWGGGGAD